MSSERHQLTELQKGRPYAEYPLANCINSSPSWLVAYISVQQNMGVLSQRRDRFCSIGSRHSYVAGPDLIFELG